MWGHSIYAWVVDAQCIWNWSSEHSKQVRFLIQKQWVLYKAVSLWLCVYYIHTGLFIDLRLTERMKAARYLFNSAGSIFCTACLSHLFFLEKTFLNHVFKLQHLWKRKISFKSEILQAEWKINDFVKAHTSKNMMKFVTTWLSHSDTVSCSVYSLLFILFIYCIAAELNAFIWQFWNVQVNFVKLPDEYGHLFTTRNRSVAWNKFLLKSVLL